MKLTPRQKMELAREAQAHNDKTLAEERKALAAQIETLTGVQLKGHPNVEADSRSAGTGSDEAREQNPPLLPSGGPGDEEALAE